jgi:hypothetical protein
LLSKSNGINFHFALNLETFEASTVRWVACLKSWLVVSCNVLFLTA